MMCVATIFTISPVMKKNLPYDPVKSFQPVALLSTSVLSLLVGSGLPVTTFAEFVALARQRPGALNRSTGTDAQYVAMELLKLETKTNLFHVPYRDAASSFTTSDRRTRAVSSAADRRPYVRYGNVRMLAVMSAERAPHSATCRPCELEFRTSWSRPGTACLRLLARPSHHGEIDAEINAILQERTFALLAVRTQTQSAARERLASYVRRSRAEEKHGRRSGSDPSEAAAGAQPAAAAVCAARAGRARTRPAWAGCIPPFRGEGVLPIAMKQAHRVAALLLPPRTSSWRN
jgi:hypothetical protein